MSANTVNPKTGLPRYPAALCYWNTGGKRWFFQSREPKLTAVLRDYRGTRNYMKAWIGGHLTSWVIDCTATKARSIVRSLNKQLRQHNRECVLLTGREGGEK
jgi:hypothetical protein